MKFHEQPTQESLKAARDKLTPKHFGDNTESLEHLRKMINEHHHFFYAKTDIGSGLAHALVHALLNNEAVQKDWKAKLGTEKAHKIYAKNPVEISNQMAKVCANPANVQESDNIQYRVNNEGVPDILFSDAASLEGKICYIGFAANASYMGGAYGRCSAQEEYLFHNTDLSLTMPTTHSYFASKTASSVNPLTDIGATYLIPDREAYYFGPHHMKHIRAGTTQGLCRFDTDGRAYLKKPALQTDAQGHIQKKPFHALFAAMPDYNHRNSEAKAHFLTEAGFKEHVHLGLVNAYQMIAQVLEHQQTTCTTKQAVIKFSPLGCGAFQGPPFLMAAIYRVAIQQAHNDFAAYFERLRGFPQIDFSILCRNGAQYANESVMKDKFDEILNRRNFSDACKMLDPTSTEYQSEWKTFIEGNRGWKAATQPPSASAQLTLQGKAKTTAQVQTQQKEGSDTSPKPTADDNLLGIAIALGAVGLLGILGGVGIMGSFFDLGSSVPVFGLSIATTHIALGLIVGGLVLAVGTLIFGVISNHLNRPLETGSITNRTLTTALPAEKATVDSAASKQETLNTEAPGVESGAGPRI